MSQATWQSRLRLNFSPWWFYGTISLTVLLIAAVLSRHWLPHVQQFVGGSKSAATTGGEAATNGEGGHDHGGHSHGHAGHSGANSIELSEQARKNIGLKVERVVLKPFTKTIRVPGMVVERPGRSIVAATAPMTGIITRIFAIEGEAVEPGQKLFDLRLTHEELVTSQTELLKTAEELEITEREIKRIEDLIRDQALPGKQLLERQYEQQKQQVALRAQRQSLLLHGLSDAQIDNILQQRKLLRDLTVTVPSTTEDGGMSPVGSVFQVQSLKVAQGQHVNQGDTLAILANHAELFIEGEAFERDVPAISLAVENGAMVSATLEAEGAKPELVSNLRLLYLAAKVKPETRTLDFYVVLPNEKVRNVELDGRRFIAWRFRPGQRVQLQIPVETLPERIVLPAEAIAQDGAEIYVFTANGDHFNRRSVHVEYRDPQWAVIANDGSLFPGDLVAISGAKQLQLALKNKAGGGIDPHAGHNH